MEIKILVKEHQKSDLKNFTKECENQGFKITREGGGRLPSFSGYYAELKGERWQNADTGESNCTIDGVSNRFSPEQMAEWFHNNYEEIAKVEGWQTQDRCKVEFKDLPEKNRTTMVKVCERWINGC